MGVPYLEIREATNIAVVIFSLVLCVLLLRYVVRECKQGSGCYIDLSWEVKLSIGFFFIFAGEFIRAGTIWSILHFDGPGSYLTDIIPLTGALFLIVVGSLCAVRVMTPLKWGNTVWITTGIFTALLIAANFLLW